jgi:O-antigen/teichoic acid export membrane protein
MKIPKKPVINTSPSHLPSSERLSFLLKDSIVYGGASAISKAFALITFPLLVRNFSIAEYGVLDYFMVLAGLGTIFFIFGQDSAVARYFYEYEDTEDRRQLISQSLLFQLAGLAILVPVLWLSADWLTRILIESPDRVVLFKIILTQIPFLLVINFSQNLLKWTFSRTRFLAMSLGFTMVQASLLVVAVLFFDLGIAGVLWIGLTTSVLFSLLGLHFVWGWLVRPNDFRRLREMLPFALPYGVICVAGALLPALERTLTNSLLGIEAMGMYAAATKIAMLIALLVGAFQTAWGPFSLSLHKQPDAVQTYNWVLNLFVVGICLATLVITLLAKPLIDLFATDLYAGSAIVVFPLVMGLAIQTTSWITEIGIGLSKRSYLSLFAYIAAIVTTLFLIWFLTPIFGLLGVGLGVLGGHISKAFVASYLAQIAYPLEWHYRSAFLVITVTLIGGLGSTWIQLIYGAAFANLAIALTMLLVLGVGWFVVLNKPERQRVRLLFRNFFRITSSV